MDRLPPTGAPSAASRTERRREWLPAWWVGVLPLIVLSGLTCGFYARGELVDDAFIFFRYAANVLAGHGVVFNPGERVEGYTSALWLMSLIVTGVAHVDPELAVRVLGSLLAVAGVIVTARFPVASEARGDRWGAWGAAALLALSQPYHLWAVHGLETAMFTLLVALGVRGDVRDMRRGATASATPLWHCLAALTRPEGALFFVMHLVRRVASATTARERLAAFRSCVPFAATVGVQIALRFAYYGDVVPNTFHTKVGFTPAVAARGLAYAGGFFVDWRASIFLLLIPAFWAARARRDLRYVSSVCAVYVAAIIAEGGDAFPAFRFLVPILPMIYLLVAEGASTLVPLAARWTTPRVAPWCVGVLVAALAIPHVQQGFVEAREEVEGANAFTGAMKEVGRALRDRVAPGTVIALNPVGAVPYFSELRTIDMLGLTDRHIANTTPADLGEGQSGHEKGDGRYVLERRPDLILLGNVFLTDQRPASLDRMVWPVTGRSEIEITQQPELSSLYARDGVMLRDGLYFLFLRRRDVTIPGSLSGSPVP